MRHEKLICYQDSLRLVQEVGQFIKSWPKGYGYLADQLKRAASSVVLNLAEGNGRVGQAERRQFFRIALGSAAESCACLDLAEVLHLLPTRQIQTWQDSLKRIYSMISALR